MVPRFARAIRYAVCLAVLSLGVLASCRGDDPTSPPLASQNPLSTLLPERRSARPIAGRVVQRLNAGSYTYLEVEASDGARTWVVMLGDGPEAGAFVRVTSIGRREGFVSARLARTFPELVFGIVSRGP